MKHMHITEEAVSPVVGVMLMLVVTIIIAAVVSAFAGGVASSENKVPQASVTASEIVIKGVVDSTPGSMYGQGLARPNQPAAAADIYIIFEHKGGDALNLDKIGVYLGKLSEPGVGTLVSRSLTPMTGPDLTTSQGAFGTIGAKGSIPGMFGLNATGSAVGWEKYLEKYPDRMSIVITPGDKFVLHADYGAGMSSGNVIAWLQQGGSFGFPIKAGDVLTYDLIDLNTKKPFSSGQIMVPEFTVPTS